MKSNSWGLTRIFGTLAVLLGIFLIFPVIVLAATGYGEGSYSGGNYNVGDTPVPSSSSNSTSGTTNNSNSTSAQSCGDQSPGVTIPWLYGAIAQDSGSVLLYFTPADQPVTKYVLEYGTSTGNYQYGVQDLGLNSREQMSYLVKSLSPNTTYYFKVRGQNGCATGGWSNEISARTLGLVTFNKLSVTQSELQPVAAIPTSTSSSCQTYTVKSGDTLWKIASGELGSGNKYTDIITDNKDTYPILATSNVVHVGWELKLNCKNGTETTGTSSAGGINPTQPPESGYSVNVKVVDTKKQPVEGASVTIHSNPQTAKTDNNGLAVFTNVEPGNHTVQIAYNNYQGQESINLAGDVKEFNLNITIQEKPFSFSPLALGVIGVLVLIIGFLIFKLVKKNKATIS